MPRAGRASKSAEVTMLRIVPPYCGCGWHRTAVARAPCGYRPFRLQCEPVGRAQRRAPADHPVTPTVSHTNARTIASSRHAS